MLSRLLTYRPEAIPRAAGVDDRVVRLALGGRFADELLSGLPQVLLPTIRNAFDLNYTQISLLLQTLNYVAAIIEPAGDLLIDLWSRRWLLAFGAAATGLAVAVMGLAPTFALLLLGFALYGLGSGPLAHTADVVLVETHPAAPDRIFARATLLDTVGALLAPLAVAVTFWAGAGWRWLLLVSGAAGLVYAVLLLRTSFPPPAGRRGHGEGAPGAGMLTAMRANVRVVLSDPAARGWLLFGLLHAIQELPAAFVPVWLGEQVGLSQGYIGVYRALEMVAGLASLLFLERWRQRASFRRVLTVAGVGVLLLYPAWLFLPGAAARFLLGMPLAFLLTVFWPVGRAQALVSVPGRAGTITAVASLFGFIPLPLLFGLVAERLALTPAMLVVHTGATVALLLLTWRLPDGRTPGQPA